MGKESYFMEKAKSFIDIYSKVVMSHSNDVDDPTFIHRELEGAAVDQTSDLSSRLRFNNWQNKCSPSIFLQKNRKVKQDPSLSCILPFVKTELSFFLLQGGATVVQGVV